MKVAWSGRIGSREGDVMGLCDGARDFRPCIVQKSKKIARKNCAKNARIPALGYGAVKGKEENQEAP